MRALLLLRSSIDTESSQGAAFGTENDDVSVGLLLSTNWVGLANQSAACTLAVAVFSAGSRAVPGNVTDRSCTFDHVTRPALVTKQRVSP